MIQIKNSALLPYVAKNNLTKIPALLLNKFHITKCGDFLSNFGVQIKNLWTNTYFVGEYCALFLTIKIL